MKIISALLLLSALAFVGCETKTFQQNIDADRASTTTAGMNAGEEGQVQDMAEGGQLNSYEEQQMDESIGGNSTVVPTQPSPVY